MSLHTSIVCISPNNPSAPGRSPPCGCHQALGSRPGPQPATPQQTSLRSSPSSVSTRATPLQRPGCVAVLSPSLAPQRRWPQPTAHSFPAALHLVHSLHTGASGEGPACQCGRQKGWEDPLEEGLAIHSSIIAWRIPWTEEPGGLQSMGSPRVSHG